MKIIRIFIAFVVVSLVVGLGSAFNGKPVKELDTAKTNQIEHEEQKEVKNDTQIEEKTEENNFEEERLSTKTVEKEKNIPEQKTNNEQKENKPTQSKQKQVEKSVIKEPKQEEQKEMTAWEELGMTEDEYYNKPAWSWARVDFPIEKYGSEEACFNACIKYGEESEMGFSCSTINSASGRYLGEMIKLF